MAEYDGCVKCSIVSQFRYSLDVRQTIEYTLESWEAFVAGRHERVLFLGPAPDPE